MARNPAFNQQLQLPHGEAFSFDYEAFTDAIQTQGIKLIHFRAMACPVGIINKNDTTHRVHLDHPNCANGFRYTKQGVVTALFTGNSTSPQTQDLGVLDGSTVSVTIPHEYDDGKTLYLANFDRLYLDDDSILAPQWELVEFNVAGRDRLRFPVHCVAELVDNRGETYQENRDFDVVNGGINWRSDGRNPGVDLDASGRGRVYSVYYLYQPYWYVSRLGHDMRLSQMTMPDGERGVRRMPFQAQLTRENVYENIITRDNQDGTELNGEMPQVSDGSLPPR